MLVTISSMSLKTVSLLSSTEKLEASVAVSTFEMTVIGPLCKLRWSKSMVIQELFVVSWLFLFQTWGFGHSVWCLMLFFLLVYGKAQRSVSCSFPGLVQEKVMGFFSAQWGPTLGVDLWFGVGSDPHGLSGEEFQRGGFWSEASGVCRLC